MKGFEELSTIHPALLILILSLLFAQGMWIFQDASKRGESKWLWGLYGLIQIPTSLIIYLLVTRKILKTKNCPKCSKNIKKDSVYCPYCGQKVK